jgi:preprotein translocase subunit SecY
MLQALKPLIDYLPIVKKPEKAPGLQEKIFWTLGVLVLFFVMGQIYPIGVDPLAISQRFERLEILLGSKIGTLITAGIGPIVLASIFLQLAVGSKLIEIDLSTHENKRLFQGVQKLAAIALSLFEAIIYVISNYVPANHAAPLFGSFLATQALVAVQLALGSIILIYLDEIVQKYGIGSGISLFIAAGVSQSILIGAFSLVTSPGSGVPTGLIPQAIYYLFNGDAITAFWQLVPIIFTVLIFLLVVYVEGMKIELPLAYGRASVGFNYPLKFLYVSNIPVILASAVLLNVQVFGLMLAKANVPILGKYDLGDANSTGTNQPISGPEGGLAYYSTALPSPLLITGGYPAYIQYISSGDEILHILVYGLLLVSLSVVFGWFWIESTGMGAKEVAEQFNRMGLQIPGFRQDPRIIEKLLEKYIPVITILGSIFVGLLAWFADITGALGTGTGILLTVGIIYKLYEDLAQQQVFEMYPSLKKIMK